jgi:hypothetical protein
MKTVISGEADGEDIEVPLEARAKTSQECRRVDPDAAMRLEFTFAQFEAQRSGTLVAWAEEADLGPPDSMRLSPTGEASDTDIPGADRLAALSPQFARLSGPVALLRFPEDGIRVGEAVDAASLLSRDVIQGLLRHTVPGMDFEMEGELVLDRVEGDGDARSAVFVVNVVAGFESHVMDIQPGFALRMTGEIRVSVSTGWPIGTSATHVTGSGKVMQDGEISRFEVSQDIESTSRRVIGSAPDAGE